MHGRFLAVLFVLCGVNGLTASAQEPGLPTGTQVFRVGVDSDVDTTTGCAWTRSDGSVIQGIELQLILTVDASGAMPMVTGVSIQRCEGGVFESPLFIDGGWPVAVNVGVDGSDAIEAYLPHGLIGRTSQLRLYGDGGSSLGGTDTLAGVIFNFPAEIPTLGFWGILVLLTVLLASGIVYLRFARKLGKVGLTSLFGFLAVLMVVATMMHFAADGDIADWAGLSPVLTDPEGDSSDPACDILALFAASDDQDLFFRFDVVDLENHPPEAVDDAFAVTEDSSNNSLDVLANDSDLEGDPITITAVGTPSNGGTVAIVGGLSLNYTPAANFFGTETFTYTIADGQGGEDTATVTMTVNNTNDNPTATDDALSVFEDTTANTLDVLANDSFSPDAGETLTITAVGATSNGGTAVIGGGGTSVSYSPAADYNGTDTFTYTLSDGNGGTDTATVTVTVDPVNDAPSFVVGDDQTVLEDAGAQTVVAWAKTIEDNDPATQTLTFNVTGNTNPSLFSAAPAISGSTGNLTFTPAANANGSADITVTLSDNGGTANGGVDTSGPETFTITITAVNDVPSYTSGGDVTILEDAGAQRPERRVAWASNLSAGPTDEQSQTLTFNVTGNTNPDLFSMAPTIDSTTGELHYQASADGFGSADITITLSDDGGTANGGVDTTDPETFTITVSGVNDAPSFTAGGPVGSFEDEGAYTYSGWATGLDDGDGGGQTLTFNVTSNTNPGLFSVAPAIDGTSGDLTFTSTGDASGSADITVTLSDNGGTANGGVDTSGPATFTITVTAVNDAPSFTAGADQTVLEDVGAQSVAGWATNLSAGPSDESGQTLTFNITGNTNPDLFSTGPSVASDGTLTYTPAANAFGSADVTVTLSDDGGTANGGVDTSAGATFTITVTGVNDEPSFTKGADVTFVGAAVGQTVAGWATNLNPGPNENSQTLTFNITGNTNPGLFSAGPAVNGTNGNLTYTPASEQTGTATITLEVQDNGGTANGGDDTSASQTFVIDITAQNQEPSFTAGADQTDLEDAGAQTVAGWATNIDDGDGGGQVLTFNVTGNTNAALFAVAPSIDPSTGDLTYTPADDANGSSTITVNLQDDGGTSGGGDDTSADASFTITVTAVNDEPTFTAGADQSVAEDAGGQTVVAWATDISAGPADEAGQGLTFNITGNTLPALFSVDPAIDASGNLTYTPAADVSGTTTLTVNLMDDGGTANGGDDTSASVNFDIEVTPVNDPPVAGADADYGTHPHITLVVDRAGPSHGHLVSTFANVLDNDSDPDSASFAITTVVGSGDTTEPFTGSTSQGGSVELYEDGSFHYHPPDGVTGVNDTFQYTVEDADGDSADATVTIAIAAEEPIWFIDTAAAGGGDGTIHTPFNTFAGFNGSAHDADDTIFVYRGNTGTTPLDAQFELLSGQTLHGEGNALSVTHPEDASTASVVAAGTRPVLVSTVGDVVTLGTDSDVLGVEIRPTMGIGILSGTGGTKVAQKAGTVTIDNVVVSPTNSADALYIGTDSGTTTVTDSDFRGLAGHSGNGLMIDSSSNTVSLTSCTLGNNGTAIRMLSASGDLTLTDSTITQNAAGFDNQVLFVFGGSSGSFTLSGTSSITVDNLVGNAIHINGANSEFDLTTDATTSVNIDAADGSDGIYMTGLNASSSVSFAGPVNITGAGDQGVALETLLGAVNFDDLAISGATNAHFDVSECNATLTVTLDGTTGITSTAGRSLEITGMTGGSFAFDGGTITDGASGVLINGNTLSAASSIANVLDIDHTSATGLAITSNSGSQIALSGSVDIDASDLAAAAITNNANVSISDASVTVLDGGGGGALAVNMTNNTTLAATFTSVTATNAAGEAINLDTNGGTTTFNNLALTTTDGIAFDAASAGTVNINNGGGGTANVTATNALGLDITNTTLGSTGGTSTFTSVNVSGTGGGINLNTTTGTLILSDVGINVSGGTAVTASSATLNIDPTNANSATVAATGQRAFTLTSATTSGFNLATTSSTGTTNGIVASSCTGTFNFGDTTVTSTGTGVDLSSSASGVFTFDDLDITASAGVALSASSAGTVNVDTNDDDSPALSATTRPVLDIDNCTLNMNLATLTSASSTTHGLDLTNILTGSVIGVSGNTSVTSPTSIGANFDDIDSGSSLVFGNYSVTNRGSHGIFIQDHDGTTITFGDADITNAGNAGDNGVTIQAGTGTSTGSVQFASLDISATNTTVNRADAGADAVPDAETHDGHAVKLVDHTGGLIVTGDGTQGNGGTIQDIDGDAFHLTRSGGLDLDELTINNIGVANTAAATVDTAGIFAYQLVGTNQISNSTISRFQDGSVASGTSGGIWVFNDGTSFTELRLTDTTMFNDASALYGDDAIQLVTQNAVNGSLIIESAFALGNVNNNSEIHSLTGAGVNVAQNGSGTLTVSITDTTFRDAEATAGFGGIELNATGSGTFSATVDECLLYDLYPLAINNSGVVSFLAMGTSNYDGTVNNCTFGASGERTSAGRGAIRAQADDTAGANAVADFDITITNNTIDDTNREAISIMPRGAAVPAASGQEMDIVITGNDIGSTTPVANEAGLGREGIEFVAIDDAKIINLTLNNNTVINFVDSSSDETVDIDVEGSTTVNAIVRGNTFNQSGNPGTADSIDFATEAAGSTLCLDMNSANTSGNACPHGIVLSETFGTFNIEDIGGAANSAATVDTYIEARNTGSATVTGTFDSCNDH